MPCSWIGSINIVKMSIQPKGMNRFNATPIKLPTIFFTELKELFSQFVWTYQKPWIAKTILRKNEPGGTNLLDFRPYQKAAIIKTVWYCHKDRNIDQWNKPESPEINPHTYGQLHFDKGGKNIQWKRINVVLGKLVNHVYRMKLAMRYHHMQVKWLLSSSLQIINAGEGVEKREPSYTVGGTAN